jgi:2,3-bisphosphoglycerate-dependent phosphoglycerate mutase
MELIFVRHGLPEREVANDSSAADPGLSSTGSAQAVALGEWLGREPLDVIAQSPARRARETAAPLARRCGLTPITLSGLKEFDAGSASYVPVEEMRAAGDPKWELLRQGRLYGTDEEAQAFRLRVVASVESLLHTSGTRTALVCHGGVINAYLGHILGIEKPLWFAARYTGVCRVLAARTGERSLMTLNEVPHLARCGLRFGEGERDGPSS